MANQKDDIETEELIKRTAKKLFFEEGKFNATTQEIADSAGVNRTLINYYFRSRDNLFNLVFEDAIKSEEELRKTILDSEMPFKQKLETFIEASINLAIEYPYLETYIVSKINEGVFYKEENDWDSFFKKFDNELKAEIKKGNIDEIDSIQFVFNIASLVSFPMAVRPLFQTMMKLSDEDYDRIINERKEIIMKMVFKN